MRGPKISGSKVLVVDGCRVTRANVRQLLCDIGVSVVEEAENGAEAISKLIPFVKAQQPVDGKPTAYVCENYSCKAPVTDLAAFVKLLDAD